MKKIKRPAETGKFTEGFLAGVKAASAHIADALKDDPEIRKLIPGPDGRRRVARLVEKLEVE